MLRSFQQYIRQEQLFQPQQRILLAVSGGVDSVVLCHLFHRAKLNFGIAHCNFQLRGKASEEDATFVEKLANELEAAFFKTTFATEKIASERKISIQMAARDLRYEWLEHIRSQEQFDYIATAHHLNDSIETVLYNLTKGCGIRGLHGILPKVNQIVRPLLFATKKQIEAYTKAENTSFRHDASNDSDKYERNKLRHHVLPVLRELNPNFEQTAAQSIQHLRQAEQLYDVALATLREKWLTQTDEKMTIELAELQAHPAARTILYEWLSPFGFHQNQVGQLLESAQRQAGGLFFSDTHELLIDRTQLIVQPTTQQADAEHFFPAPDGRLSLKEGILQIKGEVPPPATFTDDENVVYLDFSKLVFPLKLRRWQPGDVFQPLGMQGKHQKLQDFFTNQKLSRFDKERIWLLESAGEICWIVGHRLDERFKVTAKTQSCLHIHWQTN